MRVALSWSGGKDGCLALARLRTLGADVTLVHLTDAATRRDRAHGVPDFVVEAQAGALGVPLWLGASDVAGYEREFLRALDDLKPDAAAFGDIDFAPHREWGEQVAARAGVDALWPLWNEPTHAVAREVVRDGWRAFVTACHPPLTPAFLGRFLDDELVEEATAAGADPAGERGEYHTLVVGGPLFRRRVDVVAGDVRAEGDGWRLEVGLKGC